MMDEKTFLVWGGGGGGSCSRNSPSFRENNILPLTPLVIFECVSLWGVCSSCYSSRCKLIGVSWVIVCAWWGVSNLCLFVLHIVCDLLLLYMSFCYLSVEVWSVSWVLCARSCLSSETSLCALIPQCTVCLFVCCTRLGRSREGGALRHYYYYYYYYYYYCILHVYPGL